jgi:hypothetical protein
VIDEIYQVHMSRQQVLDHVDAPLFESFREHGVIRVRKRVGDHVPGLIIPEELDIKKLSQELDSRDDRVSVIHLYLVKFGEIVPVAIVELESFNDILNSRTAEEELLLKSQFLTLPLGVVRVEHTGNILSSLPLHDRLIILCIVELLKIEFV